LLGCGEFVTIRNIPRPGISLRAARGEANQGEEFSE
jgi:hypothetical protein